MRPIPLLLLAGLATALVLAVPTPEARASSHAEAPMIADDPQADATDLYAFRSPENPDKVVILANYIPLQEPSGGPNWKLFSDGVLYQIKVDRNGDALEDLIFSFVFTTRIRTPGTFLNFLGPVTALTTDNGTVDTGTNVSGTINRYQTYDLLLTRVNRGSRRTTTLARRVLVPPVNVGPTTTPNYEANLAQKAIHTVAESNIRVFAGQRDDPFFIDLGAVFDLLQVRPFRGLSALQPQGTAGAAGIDTIAGFNCHTLALEVPIALLTGTAQIPGSADASRLLGFWTTASRPRVSVLRPGRIPSTSGGVVPVSRLGAPLVNELFIPIADRRGYSKDFWNSVTPDRDPRFFRAYFEFPEPALRLAQIYPALRGVVPGIQVDGSGTVSFTSQPRTDLLGGVTPLLNLAPDLLRLDVSVAPSAAAANRLGALGGDPLGFPNGRRLLDDVVDIYIRAGAGALVGGEITVGDFTGSRLEFLNSVNLGDGVDANTDQPFLDRFPFAGTPTDGVTPRHAAGPTTSG
jgi:hypothetical protein